MRGYCRRAAVLDMHHDYRRNYSESAPKVIFEEFKILYDLDPDNWYLYDTHINYKTVKESFYPCFKTFRDYYLYQLFVDKLRKKEEETEKIKNRKQSREEKNAMLKYFKELKHKDD